MQHEGQSLLQLRPEDVGYDGYSSSKDGAASKQVSQSDTEGDPLVNIASLKHSSFRHKLLIKSLGLNKKYSSIVEYY